MSSLGSKISKIRNPESGRLVNRDGIIGRKILAKRRQIRGAGPVLSTPSKLKVSDLKLDDDVISALKMYFPKSGVLKMFNKADSLMNTAIDEANVDISGQPLNEFTTPVVMQRVSKLLAAWARASITNRSWKISRNTKRMFDIS